MIELFDMPPASAGFSARGRWLIDRLMGDLGITEAQAAGIVGNLGFESGSLTMLHEIGQDDGKGGYGWAQWTAGRRVSFMTWCQDHGMAWQSDEANYGYLLAELRGDIPRYDFRYVVTLMKRCGTVDDAVFSFGTTYERPGGTTPDHLPGYADRLARAKEALAGPRVGTSAPTPSYPSDVVAAALAVSRLDDPERKLVQMGLKGYGLYAGAIDGLIGPRTKAALAAWRARE